MLGYKSFDGSSYFDPPQLAPLTPLVNVIIKFWYTRNYAYKYITHFETDNILFTTTLRRASLFYISQEPYHIYQTFCLYTSQ